MSRLQNVKSDMNTERLVEYTNRLKVTLQSQSQEKLNMIKTMNQMTCGISMSMK